MNKIIALIFFIFNINIFALEIKKIDFDGIVHISKEVAKRYIDFNEGDNITKKDIDDAVKKFYKLNYFDDIWVDYTNKTLTFHFKEKEVIVKVELEGWKENDEDVMKQVVRIKKGSLFDTAKLEEAKKRIIEAINKDGKIDSVVEIKTEKLKSGGIKVTFVVNEGEEIIIDNLKYSGVKKLDSDDFDDVIANKEHQFMGWFWGRNDGVMHLNDLKYDPLRIRDYYMQHGFLDAKVSYPFVKVDFNSYKAKMSYHIKEGEAYTIEDIKIFQTKKVIDENKLVKSISLKKGEVFNIKKFREDADKIKTKIADLSYAYVQVIPDLRKDEKNHKVVVVFKVIPGEKVRIRDVIISGNTRTLDRVIRRELFLGPGDMYSLTDLRDSRNAINRLGYFEGATIEEKRVDNHTMDLIVKVKEAPTGNIQIGGGYGSYGGLLLSISVNDRNVFGSGINVGIRAEKSQRTKNASFSISNPRLNDSDFSGSFSIFYSHYEYNDYAVDSQGVSVGTGHRFSRFISGYIGYTYSNNKYDVFNIQNFVNQNLAFFFESYSKSSVSVSAVFDNTDDYYLPRSGFILSQGLEKAGLGSDADFLKSSTKFSKYYGLKKLVGFDAIFRYKARLFLAIDNGYLPIAERFYMGGIGSVRGFQAYSLSPIVEEVDSNGVVTQRRVGGKKTFSNSVEVSFPFVPKARMRLVTYVDWGFIGNNKIDEISRGGYGAGIEWFSPVGPIQLMFSRPINDQPGDRTATFEFTMGQKF